MAAVSSPRLSGLKSGNRPLKRATITVPPKPGARAIGSTQPAAIQTETSAAIQPAAQSTGQGELATTVITYEYDPLYRLTAANYTGAITATYGYAYDAVGNMTAYTETVGAETTSVSRTFDPANRLQTALDASTGTTSYAYDNNGNLVQILPPGVNPGDAGEQVYVYDQRNLLTSNTIGVGGGVYDPVADYVYDGDGNRVGQVDHSGGGPVTTSYSNDNLGLTQVLMVASNSITTTHNLFGLDLLGQQTNGQTNPRTFLADGLGSVRTEMAGSAVETVTTYEPYGNLLAQTAATSSSPGTTYGFTGEQHDAATGLLYLRARYYNPDLNQFQSRDPFVGYAKLPATLNGYSYANNNPINFTDSSGLCAEFGDDGCWGIYDLIVHSCPECVDMLTGNGRPLHEQSGRYLQEILTNVKAGWRPVPSNWQPFNDVKVQYLHLNLSPLPPALQWPVSSRLNVYAWTAANRYGVPPEIVAGVLEAEIRNDTDFTDIVGDIGLRIIPYVNEFVDMGPGVGNIHLSTARSISQYYEDNYQECMPLHLGFRQDESRAALSLKLVRHRQNVNVVAAYVRQFADYRFGSNGRPLTTGHADLSEWTMADAIAIWHGYRYGVPGVSPSADEYGFLKLEDFQDRSYSLDKLINSVLQGSGAQQSAWDAVPIFRKYLDR